MYKKLFYLISAIIIGFTMVPDISLAVAPFYEGKTIRLIVGFSAGGGFDLYARTIARHMGKHIPGNPSIIVENMTGAGSLISANYVYKIAKPDGLTIGHFNATLFLNQVLEQPGIEFDARKFEFIGAAVTEDSAYAFTKASGITSIEKWMGSKTPVKMGGSALGTTPDNLIRIAKGVLGLPTQFITGYKGTADIRLAAESGEIAGSAWSWYSMRVAWRKALEVGDVVVVMQGVPKPFPDLPNVPLAVNLAKTEEARQLIEVGIHSPGVFARGLVLPPGTPKEQVRILVKAFQETLKDKEFLAEAEKGKLDLNPITAEELKKAVAAIFKISPSLSDKLKEILFK
jgi:tripartite-type tricarboxylate transporter receptor subunit TctC